MAKYTLKGNFVRERLTNPERYTDFRTLKTNQHRVILGRKPGHRWGGRGSAEVQAILHPRREAAPPNQKFSCADSTCRRLSTADQATLSRAADDYQRAIRRR